MAPIIIARRKRVLGIYVLEKDSSWFFKFTITTFVLSIFLAGAIGLLCRTSSAQKEVEVDMALVLAIDGSSSVDHSEFNLQIQGLARAFASPDVIDAIKQCPLGRIAISVVEWSGSMSQIVAVPWSIVSDSDSAHRVAYAISTIPRQTAGHTSISAAIDFGIVHLAQSPVKARRHVIDISGDGVEFSGRDGPGAARDRAVAAGITINGLTILDEFINLDTYFKEHVAGGPQNFVIVANDYEAYGTAIKRKLLKETRCPPVS